MQTKTVTGKSIELKQEEEGQFSAVFATLNVIDKDGDVIVPGAIRDGQKVRISAYNHSSWGHALPVGKGVVTEQGEELVVDGQFFLDTSAGSETYKTVKNLEDLTEYSFGFDITDSEPGDMDGNRVQYLKGLNIYEVSPVLLGAGINTRTVDIKQSENKAAIPEHDADTTDAEWDSGEQVDRLTNGGNYSVYRRMFAWVDAEGERENKTSYKFPHHMVDSDGMPGEANTRACIAAIAALNGARGGANIPADDKQGVYDHVAKHLRDAGEDVPELASADAGEEKGERFADHADRVRGDVEKLVERCRDIASMRKQKGKEIGKDSKAKLWQIRDDLSEAVEEIDRLTEGDAEYEAVKLWAERLKRKVRGETNE